MRLDSDQQEAVRVARNVVVSAGAGSGKTSVLTSRYLRLVVEEHIPVSRILALTFTRKAAAEMYQRIYQRLGEHQDDPFVAEQLAQFDTAFISTLDSFCSTIAREGCGAFGIPPTFRVDENALQRRAEAHAVSFIRTHADRGAVKDAIRLLGFRGFTRGLVRLAMNQMQAAGSAKPSSYLPAQRAFLEAQLTGVEEQIAQAFSVIKGLDPAGPKCVSAAVTIVELAEKEQPLIFVSGRYADCPEGELEQLCEAAAGVLEQVAKIKLNCGSSKHPDVELFKETVTGLRGLIETYNALLRTIARWSMQEELLSLLDEFQDRVVAEKQQAGLVSYHDVLILAIHVLKENLPLRTYYKERFRAIMIDEFQDNNDEQKQLLYLLAERAASSQPLPGSADLDPGKLFFVGDEKQSIYRFRGADVSVFRTLADELGGAEANLILGANYRSEPGLIQFFNSFFSHVFQGATGDYEARFSPLRHRAASEGVSPSVEFWRIEGRESGNDDFLEDKDAQAYYIASRVRALVESRTLLVGPDARPAGYDDIAILLKSSSNQIRLERMLRIFGVPYTSTAVRSLFLEAPVNDIYNVLQLALYPQDRVAYAAYLRSPLAAVSDEGIVRLLLGDKDELFAPVAGLSEQDQQRLERAHNRYRQIVEAADARPITALLHIIWYEWGYRYHLLRREEYVPYLEYYDLFWELAHSFEDRGLSAFLDEVRGHLGQNEKLDELDYLRADEQGVQIMTVHKSKGLEFPVVIVAYTENKGVSESVTNAPYYWHPEYGPAFNIGFVPGDGVREKSANYLFTMQAEQARLEAEAERKRLLYVAATRAESHLVFCGLAADPAGSLNEFIAPAFAHAAGEVADEPLLTVSLLELEPVGVEEEHSGRRSAGRQRIADLALRYGMLPAVSRRYTAPELAVTAVNAAYRTLSVGEGEGPMAAGLAGSTGGTTGAVAVAADPLIEEKELAAEFGTLCHALIEHAPADGYGDDSADALEEARRAAPLSGAAARLGEREQERLYESAIGLSNNFLRSPLWGDVVAAARAGTATVEHEVPFLLRADAAAQPEPDLPSDLLIRGKIDLVVRYADRVDIIDFKSDREVSPEHYAAQLALYQTAGRELYSLPVSVSLFDLRRETRVDATELPEPATIGKAIAAAFSGLTAHLTGL